MNDQNNKSKNLFFDHNVMNVNFSIHMSYIDFKLCVPILHILSEGTLSHIVFLGLVLVLCQKTGNILSNL